MLMENRLVLKHMSDNRRGLVLTNYIMDYAPLQQQLWVQLLMGMEKWLLF
jgi:hypothetical protein